MKVVNILNMRRGSGKTMLLIQQSHTTGYPIITHTAQQAKRITEKAYQYGYTIPAPIVFNGKLSLRGYGYDKYLVDNIDMVLSDMITSYYGVPVAAVTMSVPIIGGGKQE